ncbi:MAG: class I SAM-dependent methyltransferase [Candidatus Altiarchaeota archaeon]|nr:class I SAM-dependent methyltransferase [Candidatus Altiarchaeota archaeon]
MKGSWFNFFKDKEKLEFTKEVFEDSMKALDEDLMIYLRHADKGAKVLECCCGPGYTAIPLSHHFNVTAFDRDSGVLDYARSNAVKFGKNITFKELDFFDIEGEFGTDSFDACSSGGVLEHFSRKDVRRLIDLQLKVAPVVFASMPLGEGGGEKRKNEWGIVKYEYDSRDWIEDVLNGYNIIEYRTLPYKPEKMRFREFMAVIGRKSREKGCLICNESR